MNCPLKQSSSNCAGSWDFYILNVTRPAPETPYSVYSCPTPNVFIRITHLYEVWQGERKTRWYAELSKVIHSYLKCPTRNSCTFRSPALYKSLLRLQLVHITLFRKKNIWHDKKKNILSQGEDKNLLDVLKNNI